MTQPRYRVRRPAGLAPEGGGLQPRRRDRPPGAILWTDEKREWERLVPRLRLALPHFLDPRPLRRGQPHRPGDLAPVRAGGQGRRTSPCRPTPFRSSTCRASAARPCGPPRSARTNSSRWPSCNTGACSGRRTTARTGPSPPSSRPRRAGCSLQARQGSGHGDVDPPGHREAGRCAGRRPASQVRRWRTRQPLLRLADQRRPGGRPAVLAVRPEGHPERWEPGRWEALCSRCNADYGFDPVRTANSSVPRSWDCRRSRPGRRPGSDSPPPRPGIRAGRAAPQGQAAAEGGRPARASAPWNSGPRTTRPRKPSCGRPSSRLAAMPRRHGPEDA